jgi:hypothetical protein
MPGQFSAEINIEQPSGGLGTINDMWFRWVIDIGHPGPDRGLEAST